MVTISLALALLLCLIAAGCLGGKTPLVSRPAAPLVFIDYHRTGGIAGFDDRLVIFDNGAAIVSTKTASREIVLNATETGRISELFEQAGFSQLQANYPARHGSDLLQYSIRYQNKTVTLEESAYPDTVKPVIEELDRIVTRSAA